MATDSLSLDLIALNPLPAILLDPARDAVLQHNQHAERLFETGFATPALAPLLNSNPMEFSVFLEAVLHYGDYSSRRVAFRNRVKTPLNVEVFGRRVDGGDGPLVFLSFLDLDQQRRKDDQARQDVHQRAGLLRWREVYHFFQEVERENQLILDAAGEGIYGINAQGKATFVNRAAQDMLGWDAEDLVGRELHSIIHHHHLDGTAFPAKTCPIYKSFRQEQTQRVENDAFWRKDGKPILVEYVSTPIYDHGVLVGAVVIFRDVTERKENERKLRSALEEIENLRTALEQENDYLVSEIQTERSGTGLLGVSPSIRNINAQIALLADTDANVLISGKNGTGKAHIASLIHAASDRRKRPLVRVDCSAKSVQEFEAELFGYRRGAFRGAARDTVGKLVLAQNGTLYLEEVAAMPPEFQARLLAVLQDGQFQRLGDTTMTPIALRIVSTTNRNLEEEAHAGRFRQDLFFELSVFPIRTQNLKQRIEDIPYLAQHFLEQTQKRLRLPPMRFSKSNIETLQAYDWPGNVRELKNVIERAAILAQGGRLKFAFSKPGNALLESPGKFFTEAEFRALERQNLLACLRRSGGRISGPGGAADMFGIAPTTLRSRMKSFGIALSDLQDEL